MACRNKQPLALIQVCYELNYQNNDRETKGIYEAMNFFDIHEDVIITSNQRDLIISDNKTIRVIPAYEFLITNL